MCSAKSQAPIDAATEKESEDEERGADVGYSWEETHRRGEEILARRREEKREQAQAWQRQQKEKGNLNGIIQAVLFY